MAIRNEVSGENPVVIKPIDEDSIAGYTILKDIYGNPALYLQVIITRDIYKQSKLGERYLFISLIVVGIIIGCLFIILLEKLVLSRLSLLSSDVKAIGKSRELSERVNMDGKDELSSLARSINGMLEALELSNEERNLAQEELRKHRDNLEELVDKRTSELKKSSEKFKNSEEKYRSLVESSDDSIYMVDRDCRYLFVNNKHIQRLGIKDYSGRKYNEFHSDNESKRFSECIEHVFETKASEQHDYEYDNNWFNQTLSPVKNPETGKVTAVTVVSTNITLRKRAEEVRLENERLAYSNKAKSEFLANMSHELRTPLNAIIGFSELLRKKGKGTLNEKMEHYVDIVITSSKFLLDLINDILDLSKVEAGKIELVYEKMQIHESLDETLLLIKEKAETHNILIKKEFDTELSFIDADKQRFKQVIFNLLSNALKFSKKEGGTIRISTKKEGDMANISVSDTGIGIKEESIGKLFNAFEQLDSGITRNYGGTGLGLAISKKFIELHGGKILVQSKFGEGTTFTFVLPILKNHG
jgi:PAS domain S-box-containing protein